MGGYLGGACGNGAQPMKNTMIGLLIALTIGCGSGTLQMSKKSPKELVDLLRHEDLRDQAADRLREMGPNAREAVPELIAALQDPNDAVRYEAASVLLHIGPDAEAAIKPLADLAKDQHEENEAVRSIAVNALGHIGPKAIPILTDLLQDSDVFLRRKAADVFGVMGPQAQDAVAALIRAFEDESFDVRWNARGSLERIGKVAVPQLSTACEEGKSFTRVYAAWALIRIDSKANKSAVQSLAASLNNPNPKIRADAAWALSDAKADAEPALVALIGAMRDEDGHVRCNAAEALAGIGANAFPAVPVLATSLSDANAEVRCAAAGALGKIGPKASGALPALIEALKDLDWMVRMSAIDALGEIGEGAEAAVPSLERQKANDPDDEVRRAATNALARITAGRR
jgi:HEAT repeat protein